MDTQFDKLYIFIVIFKVICGFLGNPEDALGLGHVFLCQMNLELWRNLVWGRFMVDLRFRIYFLSTTNDFETKTDNRVFQE